MRGLLKGRLEETDMRELQKGKDAGYESVTSSPGFYTSRDVK
jgi:hypothetical protein